ncbi:hypothetical protein EDC94DRAFT_589980 [Helicostylum pulchrum]|nr:hypothetical protein EDC94DRAFT_589980 [Helicostylum pulchrum]
MAHTKHTGKMRESITDLKKSRQEGSDNDFQPSIVTTRKRKKKTQQTFFLLASLALLPVDLGLQSQILPLIAFINAQQIALYEWTAYCNNVKALFFLVVGLIVRISHLAYLASGGYR